MKVCLNHCLLFLSVGATTFSDASLSPPCLVHGVFFFHLVLRFWNHILTCCSVKPSSLASQELQDTFAQKIFFPMQPFDQMKK